MGHVKRYFGGWSHLALTLLSLIFFRNILLAQEIFLKINEAQAINLPNHPDWHAEKGQGWYTKEHYHAEDFAFMVCDEESAGASVKIKNLNLS
ncbi:MAG: hypothetical protein ACYTFY_14160 [Planctomycetota bacterium]|jgi:hypothetical protein